jgi:ParB family chromosome partitioning protein
MAQDKIINLSVEKLQANPLQPRGVITPDSLMELVDSIKEHGILEPLVVAHTPAGYQIIAGERRWRAAKLAGIDKVPAVVKETSPKGMLEMALVENVQREDLNPLERAKAFERLQKDFKLSVDQIAERISKSKPYVYNTLNLLNLPAALKDGLLSGAITEGHARALLGIKDKKLMIKAYKQLIKESGSVRRAEEIARRMKAQMKKEGEEDKGKRADEHIMLEQTRSIQNRMRSALGEDAQVKLVRTRMRSKVYIILKGSPKKTEEKFRKICQSVVEASQ